MIPADDHRTDRLVLIVGAHRSGTTWLQQLLLSHPLVGGVERTETWLFRTLQSLWDSITDPGGRGLSVYLTEERGAEIIRRFTDEALDRAAAGTESPARVVEKTPAHSMHMPLIAALYPRAWVIHLVRDGRDVVQSSLDVGFGARGVVEAAQQWKRVIERVRADLPRFERHREVRYEHLLLDPVPGAAELLRWIGLEVDQSTTDALERRALERVSRFDTTGGVGAGKWRRLDQGSLDLIEAEVGPLLRELGYVDDQPA